MNYFTLKRNLTDESYVISHIQLCVQKKGNEQIIKKQFLNVEVFMRIFLEVSEEETKSVKVNSELLDLLGISEEKAWSAAEKNSINSMTVRSISEVLGFPENQGPLFYVATTGMKNGGTVVILPEVLRQFCLQKNISSVLILPSSTEEMLLVETDNTDDYLDFARMVYEVNSSTVDPDIQLEPCVYRFSMRDRCVSIVGRA